MGKACLSGHTRSLSHDHGLPALRPRPSAGTRGDSKAVPPVLPYRSRTVHPPLLPPPNLPLRDRVEEARFPLGCTGRRAHDPAHQALALSAVPGHRHRVSFPQQASRRASARDRPIYLGIPRNSEGDLRSPYISPHLYGHRFRSLASLRALDPGRHGHTVLQQKGSRGSR